MSGLSGWLSTGAVALLLLGLVLIVGGFIAPSLLHVPLGDIGHPRTFPFAVRRRIVHGASPQRTSQDETGTVRITRAPPGRSRR